MKRFRIVEPTLLNASRFAEAYQFAYLDDEELYRAVCGNEVRKAINGMTEPASSDGLLTKLLFPNTISSEIYRSSDPVGPPEAFVINHLSGSSPSAVNEFQEFILTEVFLERDLRFSTTTNRRLLHTALTSGRVFCCGESLSTENEINTAALTVANYELLLEDIYRDQEAYVLGKCLESARMGPHRNTTGNVRVRRLAETFGLELIATQDQLRQIACTNGLSQEVILTFGLYLGKSDKIRRRMQKSKLVNRRAR